MEKVKQTAKRNVIIYQSEDETRVISNKQKAFKIAKAERYRFSYNQFCSQLKLNLSVDLNTERGYISFKQYPIE